MLAYTVRGEYLIPRSSECLEKIPRHVHIPVGGDAETGDQAWRTYTVPGNPADGCESEAMRVAAETWTGEW